jgi:hypothetical protein
LLWHFQAVVIKLAFSSLSRRQVKVIEIAFASLNCLQAVVFEIAPFPLGSGRP